MSQQAPTLESLTAEVARLESLATTLKAANEKLTADMANFDLRVAREMVKHGIVHATDAQRAAWATPATKDAKKTMSLDDQVAIEKLQNPAAIVPPLKTN